MGRFTPESFAAAVEGEIRKQIAAIIDEEAEQAAQRVRDRVKGKVGEIATKVLSNYDIAMMGDQLVIAVRQDLDGRPRA